MKKMLLLAAVLLGAIATMHAQEKPRKRPVTEKAKTGSAAYKSGAYARRPGKPRTRRRRNSEKPG